MLRRQASQDVTNDYHGFLAHLKVLALHLLVNRIEHVVSKDLHGRLVRVTGYIREDPEGVQEYRLVVRLEDHVELLQSVQIKQGLQSLLNVAC